MGGIHWHVVWFNFRIADDTSGDASSDSSASPAQESRRNEQYGKGELDFSVAISRDRLRPVRGIVVLGVEA
jgi:hypothetical protein